MNGATPRSILSVSLATGAVAGALDAALGGAALGASAPTALRCALFAAAAAGTVLWCAGARRRASAAGAGERDAAPLASFAFPSDLAFVVDRNGSVVEANAASRRVLGYDAAALERRPLLDLVYPEDRERARAALGQLGVEGGTTAFETRCVCRDGSHRWLQWAAHSRPTSRRVEVVARDVTEPRRNEEFQRLQRRVLEMLATDAPLGAVLNALAQSIESLAPGMRCSILLLDDMGRLRHGAGPSLPNAYNEAIDGVAIGPSVGSCGTAAYSRSRTVAADIATDPRWAPWRDLALGFGLRACWSQPIVRGGGHVLGTFAMYYGEPREPAAWDLEIIEGAAHVAGIAIERRAAEAELTRARDRALEIARLKTEFLANVSHEIRTPMNVIFGMTEIALDTELSAEQREFLEAVRSSATSLLGIINDVLDFAKVDAGKLEIAPVAFPIAEMLDEALKPLALRARAKQLTLDWSIAPNVPDAVESDPGRLRQIIVNLVDNGIKFTETGGIACRVELVESGADADVLHFEVRDTGIGIPADKHSEIFGAFVQADGSTTRRYGGTGLGLAICARLVELLGGRIWVESEPGRGTAFHFTTRVRHTARALGEPSGPAHTEGDTRRAVAS